MRLLEREINFQDVQITQITAGIASESPRKKYKDAVSRINSIVRTYQEKKKKKLIYIFLDALHLA